MKNVTAWSLKFPTDLVRFYWLRGPFWASVWILQGLKSRRTGRLVTSGLKVFCGQWERFVSSFDMGRHSREFFTSNAHPKNTNFFWKSAARVNLYYGKAFILPVKIPETPKIVLFSAGFFSVCTGFVLCKISWKFRSVNPKANRCTEKRKKVPNFTPVNLFFSFIILRSEFEYWKEKKGTELYACELHVAVVDARLWRRSTTRSSTASVRSRRDLGEQQ